MSVGSLDQLAAPSGSAKDRITYTADMFGDIESHRNSKVSSTTGSQKGTVSDIPTERKSCLSRNIREDEYAQSLANGFTIIIDSVDDGNGFDVNSFSSDDDDDDVSKGGKNDGIVESKSVTFQDDQLENDFNNDDEDEFCDAKETKEIENAEKNNENTSEVAEAKNKIYEENELTEESILKEVESMNENIKHENHDANKTVHKKKSPPRPVPPATSKGKLDSKNKLGLKLKIENESMPNFSPYMKTNTSKSKATTNKARQFHTMSSKQKKSNGAIPMSVKANGKASGKKRSTESTEGLVTMETGKRNESLTSADGLEVECNTTDSSPMTNEQNQITCVADVHREKTLSPKTENGDVTSRSDQASSRQRKISVISLGTVLKDSRETLV